MQSKVAKVTVPRSLPRSLHHSNGSITHYIPLTGVLCRSKTSLCPAHCPAPCTTLRVALHIIDQSQVYYVDLKSHHTPLIVPLLEPLQG